MMRGQRKLINLYLLFIILIRFKSVILDRYVNLKKYLKSFLCISININHTYSNSLVFKNKK